MTAISPLFFIPFWILTFGDIDIFTLFFLWGLVFIITLDRYVIYPYALDYVRKMT